MKLLIDKTLPLIENIFKPFASEILYFDKSTKKMHTCVDVLICRAHTQINDAFFNGHTSKLVATATSGSDHLDKNWLSKKNIPWVDAIGSNADSVCDYVLHVIEHPKVKLGNKKIGILGVGHVGSRVNTILTDLNYDTVLVDPPREKKDKEFKSALMQDLFDCDIISIHLPLNISGPDKTHELINNAFLKQCKPGCILINTSRGEVLSEKALLDNKHLTYCLDVFSNEPEINPEVIKRCLFATPHIAGHAIEAKKRALLMLSHKIQKHFKLTIQATPYDFLLSHKEKAIKQPLTFSYDPLIETNALKKSPTDSMFLTLRKNHIHRHELLHQ